MNPKPPAPMGFFFRSHAAYRGAVGLVMGGQLYEAQALLRLVLEHALYGFYVSQDNERWVRWMNRSESEENKKNVRKEFMNKKLLKNLVSAAKNIGANYSKLYEKLIDFGAHPNEQGFTMSTQIHNAKDSTRFETLYIHEDGLPLKFSIQNSARVGICSLLIFQTASPEPSGWVGFVG